MTLAARAAAGHYVSEGEAERIGAARVERNAVMLLQRLHLIGEGWRPRDLALILRRIVVCPDCLVFQLDRRACVAQWREQKRLPARAGMDEVLRAVASWLPEGCEMADVGWMLCLTSPRRSRPRRVRPRPPME